MKKVYTPEELDAFNVFTLRDLARELGHPCSTNKHKKTLVEYILETQNKKKEDIPVLPKKRRGRPPKLNATVINREREEALEKAELETQKSEVSQESKETKELKEEPRKETPQNENHKKEAPKKDEHKKEEPKKEEEPLNYAEMEIREGVLEICPDGYGFLRAKNYEQGEGDAYISAQKLRKAGLRKGDYVKAYCKTITENRPMGVQEIISVNGEKPESAFARPTFESLVPIHPNSRFKLEHEGSRRDFAIRSIDLVAPIGKGQRAMIVSPPKAGKTTLLKKVAYSIAKNYPEAHLMVLLVDERPEEVTEMKRFVKGEVIASTFDEMPDHHTKASELVLERAKRLVECGKDVVILMDSITRLTRAYNLVIQPTGKTLSGGIDPGSLYLPKKFFGAARNIENGGSLTIIATALVDTGSRMDDVIYEEFKGTGNMEIHLDRKLSEKRIFPAIDLAKSGTRREELLLSQEELLAIYAMRRMLSNGENQEATENLIAMMMKTATNKEFVDGLNAHLLKLQKDGFTFTK